MNNVRKMVITILAIVVLPFFVYADNPVICKISVASNDKPLPLESIKLLVILQNTTNVEQKVLESFNVPFISLKLPDSTIKNGPEDISDEPMPPRFITLGANGSKSSTAAFIYGINQPGAKVTIEATWSGISSGFNFGVDVQTLSGIDQKAYEFLKTNKLDITFYIDETIGAEVTVDMLKKFIKDFKDSRYTNFARLGLGFLYWSMSRDTVYDPATKSWLPGPDAEKNLKNAKHTFKKLVDNWKEEKGSKLEPDNDDNERDDPDDIKKVAVDKNTMLWASFYLGQVYEDMAFRVRKDTTEANINVRMELLKKALKAYEFALAQSPNDYYKFILTEAKTRVDGKLTTLQNAKK